MITKSLLAEWKRLAEAATPGPWATQLLNDITDQTTVEGPEFGSCRSGVSLEELESAQPQIHDDARFIAASRTAVPALIAEVERLEAEVSDLNRCATIRVYNCPRCAYHMTTNDTSRDLEAKINRLEAQMAAARDAALEEAARILDAEVKRHRDYRAFSGHLPHDNNSYCGQYGCKDLVEFAAQIRALRGAK